MNQYYYLLVMAKIYESFLIACNNFDIKNKLSFLVRGFSLPENITHDQKHSPEHAKK